MQNNKIDLLKNANIDIFTYPSVSRSSNNKLRKIDGIMHHKFAVIDHKIVWTGSFNWTVSANKRNKENVIISDNAALIQRYEDEFQRLKKECVLKRIQKKNKNKKKDQERSLHKALKTHYPHSLHSQHLKTLATYLKKTQR